MLEEGSSQYESDAIAKEAGSGFTLSGPLPKFPFQGLQEARNAAQNGFAVNGLQFWN